MVSASLLHEAIGIYNDYRSPMATAELTSHEESVFRVRFDGPFCRMCCDYDYFEDLIYELDDLGTDAETVSITEIESVGPEAFVVDYRVKPTDGRGSGDRC